MLRDIVVHIPVDQSLQPVIDCAISMGSIFDAHLEAIACVYPALDPVMAPTFDPVIAFGAYGFTGLTMTEYPKYETSGGHSAAGAMQHSAEKAPSALDQFEISARRVGISHAARCIRDGSHTPLPTLTPTPPLP